MNASDATRSIEVTTVVVTEFENHCSCCSDGEYRMKGRDMIATQVKMPGDQLLPIIFNLCARCRAALKQLL